jgi:hypothetical protein
MRRDGKIGACGRSENFVRTHEKARQKEMDEVLTNQKNHKSQITFFFSVIFCD